MKLVKLKWLHGLRLHVAGFAAMLVGVSTITSLIAVRQTRIASANVEEIAGEAFHSMQAVSDARLASANAMRFTPLAAVTADPEARALPLRAAHDAIDELNLWIRSQDGSAGDRCTLAARNFAGHLTSALDLLERNTVLATEEAADLIANDLARASASLDEALLSASTTMSDSVQTRAADMSARLGFSGQVLTGVAIGGACVGVLGSIVFVRLLVRPLRLTAEALSAIEQSCDLTRRVPTRGDDEIGAMSSTVNSLLDRLQSIIRSMADASTSLAHTAQDLVGTADELTTGTTTTLEQSREVRTSASSMLELLADVTRSTQQMQNDVDGVARAVVEMSQSTRQIAQESATTLEVVARVDKVAQETTSKMRELDSAADEVGSVLGVIQEIAEQTNLLALNATIEAARAGEAGRGFQVVAAEVKALARQTTEATDVIRQRVEAIRKSKDQSLSAIRLIGGAVEDLNAVSRTVAAAAQQQSESTQRIAEVIQTSTETTRAVSSGLNWSAQASNEITCRIEQVDLAAEKGSQCAGRTADAGREVAKLAASLNEMVHQFRIG